MSCDHDDTHKGLLTQSHSVVFHQLILTHDKNATPAVPALLTKLSLPVLAARNSKKKKTT